MSAVAPRWTHANKDGVGTAYSAGSRVWFTLWNGHLTELYFPTLDSPQVRDVQVLLADGEKLLADETHDSAATVERMCPALGYTVVRDCPEGRWQLRKTIISDPHLPVVLEHCELEVPDGALRDRIRVHVLAAPHLGGSGGHNTAEVCELAGRPVLVAENEGKHLAVLADVPFDVASAGRVGSGDGWTDLHDDGQLDDLKRHAEGNVALTGRLDFGRPRLSDATCPADGEKVRSWTLAVGLGDTRAAALAAVLQSLDIPFPEQVAKFREQWDRPAEDRRKLEQHSADGGSLYRGGFSVLLAHEDKTYQGATVASLSIPWGETVGDEGGRGGYHLVWPRDMAHTATGLLAAGNAETPRRALAYLTAVQGADGRFAQNFWLDGRVYWEGVQLDETAYPVVLAGHLHREDALRGFDPTPMCLKAVRFLIAAGPVTGQERWEEASGYSPSTLAVIAAGCLSAAGFARRSGRDAFADLAEWYADWVVENTLRWCVTNAGELPGTDSGRYIVRILPAECGEARRPGEVDTAEVTLANRPPDAPHTFPARNVVDGGFLALVRYGLVPADDPAVVDTLDVIDAVLKTDLPQGPGWHRYNHDGYGQRDDGGPFDGWGVGRCWPLLTGERAHYELAAGGDVTPLVETIEGFASPTGLLPEQVWDADPIPDQHLEPGGPTGSAMPLAWAHAEYLTLLRSLSDGVPFDRLPEAERRYLKSTPPPAATYWSFHHPTPVGPAGRPVRLVCDAAFRVRFSDDADVNVEPRTVGNAADGDAAELDSTAIDTGGDPLHTADLPAGDAGTAVRFTFHWTDADRWEGATFTVEFTRS